MLPNCETELAHAAADRLRSAVPSGQTASAGVATWAVGESAASLLGRVDGAMYRAKEGGRNRTVVA